MNRPRAAWIALLVCLSALIGGSIAAAEVTQKGDLRVTVSGSISPKTLPRSGAAPISVSVGGDVKTTDGSALPKLKTLKIELNRYGRIETTGLPVCPYGSIQPASSSRAFSACRSSLVGQGSFSAEITLAGQAPYAINGTMLAFNGLKGGKPVLYGQIYAPRPFATSFVIIFSIKQMKGQFGTALTATLPASLRSWGNLTGIELKLGRNYTAAGKHHSYLSAGCPAPKGFPGATFSLARISFGFEAGPTMASTLSRNCTARG
ncbi:MAG TPA: hypothetical protein VN522_08840 [Solirubrobacterales bacterium]|nr:hypothetical protein [Solirubrobacterales bacterium]